jgi:multidrug efflux pump
MLMMAVVVLCGLLSRAALPIANDPHIELPVFIVRIIHEGISPEDAERLLIQPMEIELRKIEGVEELTSTASEGSGSLVVEFDTSYDLDLALLAVPPCVRPSIAARLKSPARRKSPS